MRAPGARLLRLRPDLVIAEHPGVAVLAAVLYRRLVPGSRLLLCLRGMPSRMGLIGRLALGAADAVLADSVVAARALERRGLRVYAVHDHADIGDFSSGPARRSGSAAHRIVHVGPLSPQSGAADLLIDVAAWAERHSSRVAEIWWVGEGDLRGVLAAQPLPANMSQRFLGALPHERLVGVFAQCGLLALPTLVRGGRAEWVPEALAAGLPVLGSAQCRGVRALVQDGETGWIFDPILPGSLQEALERALGCSEAELDHMRMLARLGVAESAGPRLGERIKLVLRAVLAGSPAPATAL